MFSFLYNGCFEFLLISTQAQAAKIANRDIYSASTFDTDIAVVTTRPLIEVVSSTAADSVLEFGSKVVDYAEEIDINNECDNIVTPVTDTRTNEDDRDFLNTALSVLTAMLAFGSSGRSEAEETALRALLPALQRISAMELDVSVSEKATDLAVAIMTRSVTTKTLAVPCDQKSADVLKATSICSAGINNPVGKAELTMIDLCASVSKEFLHDEHPAMRALGLRQISNALKRKEVWS